MNNLSVIENRSVTNADSYRQSTDAAGMCSDIVLKRAISIQGRRYVPVEGWQAIAIAHGCAASALSVQRVDGGYKAKGEVRRMSDGAIIAEAEGFVGEDEPVWFGGEVTAYGKVKKYQKRPDYAIRAMVQTRAISRACRSAFAHVLVLIDEGLSTIPAEEVPPEGLSDEYETQSKLEHAISQPQVGMPEKGTDDHPDWPSGPHRGISAMKTAARYIWRDILSASDLDSLEIVLSDNRATFEQMRRGWRSGWDGQDDDPATGFNHLIERKRTELEAQERAGDGMPIAGDGKTPLANANGSTIADA